VLILGGGPYTSITRSRYEEVGNTRSHVTHTTRQLHLKDGTIHNHGSRTKLCPGSHKPPLGASSLPSDRHSVASASSLDDTASVSDQCQALTAPQPASADLCWWTPVECTVIKHIPKSARSACATHLASILRAIVARRENRTNWLSLVNWSSLVLQPPKRGGKRHNVTNTIKKRISEFQPTASPTPRSAGSIGHHAASPTTMLAQAVTSKLEDGNLRAAIRLLCSEDTPAPPSLENLSKLQQKHPQASLKDVSLPDPTQYTALSVDESDVRKAVLSFPAGSSGGHDGLRPQHVKDFNAVSRIWA